MFSKNLKDKNVFYYIILLIYVFFLVIDICAAAKKGDLLKNFSSEYEYEYEDLPITEGVSNSTTFEIESTSTPNTLFDVYKNIIMEIEEKIQNETGLPLLDNKEDMEETRDGDVTVISTRKMLTSLLYEEPTAWLRCKRSCETKRYWTCRHTGLCATSVLEENAYCYIEGSLCKSAIIELIHTLASDNSTYDMDGTSTTTESEQQYLYLIHEVDTDDYDEYDDEPLFTLELDDDEEVTPGSVSEYEAEVEDATLFRKKTKGEGKCGVTKVQKPHSFLRIIGGRESPRGLWPWQVAVSNQFKEVFCGGALIAPNWVLTAAHCVRKKLFVRLAEHDINAYDDGEVEIKVEEAFAHPLYSSDTIDSDIALLKLVEDASTRGKYVRTVCLPSVDEHPPRQQKCVAAGWGKEKETHIFGSDVLMYAELPISTKKVCKMSYPDHPTTRNMFCAGYKKGGRDTCSGDSGSPFVCKDSSGIWKVHGITSFGEGCGDEGKMGVYSKVHNFLPWIYKTMNSNP